MTISISYSGIYDHIDAIDEELRSIRLSREKLRSLQKQATELGANPVTIRKCAALLEDVENSVWFRREVMNNLIANMRQTENEVSSIVRRISKKTAEKIEVSK